MPNTYIDYTAPQGSYTFSFDYLDVSNVKVYVDGTAKTQGTHYTVQTSPTKAVLFTAGNTPANGAVVRIRRETFRNAPLVDFVNGSTLIESDLDIAVKQTLYINQEVSELNDTNLAIGAGTNKYDALNKNIANVANPTTSFEAANKAYVDQQISNAGTFGSSTPPTKYTFTGDGATTIFSITGATAQNPTNYLAVVNGAALEAGVDYNINLASTPPSIVFATAPANAAKIIVTNIGFKVPTEVSVPDLSVGPLKLQDGAVQTAKLDGTVGSEAVTEAKIRNLAVTSSKLAQNSVIGGKIASRAGVACGTISSRANTSAAYVIPLNPVTYNVVVGDQVTMTGASSAAANGATYTVSSLNGTTNFSVTGGSTTASLTGVSIHFFKDQPVAGASIRPFSLVSTHYANQSIGAAAIADYSIPVNKTLLGSGLWSTSDGRLYARASFNGLTSNTFTVPFTLNNGAAAAGQILTLDFSATSIAYKFDVGHRMFIDFPSTTPADGIYTISVNNNNGTYTFTYTAAAALAAGNAVVRLLGDANGLLSGLMDNVSNITTATAANAGDYFLNLTNSVLDPNFGEYAMLIGSVQRNSATTSVGALMIRNEVSPATAAFGANSLRFNSVFGTTVEAPYKTSLVLVSNAF